MTVREAVIQAHLELGMSREESELRNRITDGCLPDAVRFTECQIQAGHERELIEVMKKMFRWMAAHPEEAQALLKHKMAERTRAN